MKFQYTIEQLEVCKKNLERDIQWYKRKTSQESICLMSIEKKW